MIWTYKFCSLFYRKFEVVYESKNRFCKVFSRFLLLLKISHLARSKMYKYLVIFWCCKIVLSHAAIKWNKLSFLVNSNTRNTHPPLHRRMSNKKSNLLIWKNKPEGPSEEATVKWSADFQKPKISSMYCNMDCLNFYNYNY